jgi:hypothetical protein
MNIVEDINEDDANFNLEEFEKQQALKIRQNAQRLLEARVKHKMEEDKDRQFKKK